MLQTLIQYQPHIYAVFITIEILRYIYNIYSSWRASRAHARRHAAAVEFVSEVYCTAANIVLFKKFTPLNEKARLAFNNAELFSDKVSESMWGLFNRVLEETFSGIVEKSYINTNEPIYDRTPRQSQHSRFEPYDNEYSYKCPISPMESTPLEPVHVDDHPLQTPKPSHNNSLNNSQSSSLNNSLNNSQSSTLNNSQSSTASTSIYEGMDLFNLNHSSNSQNSQPPQSPQNPPNTPKSQKRPRFGIASTGSLNLSK